MSTVTEIPRNFIGSSFEQAKQATNSGFVGLKSIGSAAKENPYTAAAVGAGILLAGLGLGRYMVPKKSNDKHNHRHDWPQGEIYYKNC